MSPEGSPGAERPADDVMVVVRRSVAALDAAAPALRPRCYAELIALVPGILVSTADHGRAVTDQLATEVLAAAASEDAEPIVADRLDQAGGRLYASGFPADGYQGAAHAVLRAARDVYPDDWDSRLSSAWVAYLGWAGDRLSRGAVAEQVRAAVPGRRPGAVLPTAGPAAVRSTAAAPTPAVATVAVPTAAPTSLTEVYQGLASGPFAGNAAALDSVATRIALRTGADIRYPRMDQQADPGLVVTVLAALARMGYAPVAVTPAPDPAAVAPTTRTRWWRRQRTPAGAPAPRPGRSGPAARPGRPEAPPPGLVPSSRRTAPRGTFDAFSRLGDAPAQPAPVLVAAGHGRSPSTLTEVHERLRVGAFAGNEWALDGVLTRVALRTGADVRAPRPDQVADPVVVREVVTALARMGYGELSGNDRQRPRWWGRGRRRAGPNTLTSTSDG